jgi:hypothetical protein
MDVGDLVVPRGTNSGMQGVDYGIGIIVDSYFNYNDSTEYFCVNWAHEYQWWTEYELKPFSRHA